MNFTKYTGITLLYSCPNNKRITAVQKSFITNAKTLKDLEKEIIQIRKNSDKDIKNKFGTYLGIKDVFEVNGPLINGAILGRSILWSYKDLVSAKKLLKPKSEFWINFQKKKIIRRFIAEIVFILPSPIKYNDRRTIICNVLIESSSQANVYKKAINIGKSQALKERLFGVLLQYEPELTNELKFIGISNIKFVYDNVGIGKCFEALCKKERSLSSAKRLVSPIGKFSNYKF